MITAYTTYCGLALQDGKHRMHIIGRALQSTLVSLQGLGISRGLQATPLHNAIKHEREIPFALKVELVTGTWQLERRRGTWSSKQRVETRERTLQRRTNTLRAALSGFTLSSFFLRQHTALGF
jgi:hypothetical protein